MRFTRSTKRQSQRTRQQLAAQITKDYYDRTLCGKLFEQRHGAHKRHMRSCISKHEARVREEAMLQAERIETPTPDPYSPILSDAEVAVEDTGTSTWTSIITMSGAHGYPSLTPRGCSVQ